MGKGLLAAERAGRFFRYYRQSDVFMQFKEHMYLVICAGIFPGHGLSVTEVLRLFRLFDLSLLALVKPADDFRPTGDLSFLKITPEQVAVIWNPPLFHFHAVFPESGKEPACNGFRPGAE